MLSTINPYVAAFERFQQGRAADAEWLRRLRVAAFTRFEELGLPTLHHEEWKYTNPAPFGHPEYDLAPSPEGVSVTAALAAELGLGEWTGIRLVFLDGVFLPALSRTQAPAGCIVTSLAQAAVAHADVLQTHLTQHVDGERHVFAAVNTAFTADGAFVYVPENKRIEAPVHALFISSERPRVMSHPRNLVVADTGAALTFVEHYVSMADAPTLTNAVTEVAVGLNADVRHVQVQRQSETAHFVETLHVSQLRDSRFTSQSVALGAALARNDYAVVLDGENAACTLDGLYMVAGKRHVDYHTSITHARAHCTSRELFKGIIADRGTGVFNGRIVVPPASQKTDSEQGSHTLLLSRDATINAKPELEIFADDVKCAHGATVGQIDEQAVFYLRARGLSRDEARAMLTHAFAVDVLERVPIEPLRNALNGLVSAWLPAGAQGT